MLVLWDADMAAPEMKGVVYAWRGHSDIGSVYSLLRYAEINGHRLRRKYLSFTHELGEKQIKGKSLIEHLSFKDGLSYWWMTIFVEQHYYNLPLVDAIRLLALEEILTQRKPREFLLVSADKNLHQILKNLCQKLAIKYKWRKQKNESVPWSKQSFYWFLPYPIQACMSLLRYLRVNYKKTEISGWFEEKALFLCGYFINLDPGQADEGRFYSRYWGGLHALVQNLGIKTNWLHHNVGYGRENAINWVQQFNSNKDQQGFHAFLDAYLSWAVIINVVRKWIFLNVIYWRLRDIKKIFFFKDTGLSFWPLMKKYWQDSLLGPAAITNLLSIELFDSAIRHMPHQKMGLFLYENHAWERALIHAWRKYGHGQLVAVAHSTVRFWDLRYFIDQRTFQSSKLQAMPRPDFIALNGRMALEAFLGEDYPKEALIECEALRFSYLNTCFLKQTVVKNRQKVIRVLILGDILISATDKMLCMLETAMSYLTLTFSLTLKPHPMCPIKVEHYPHLRLTLNSEPLERIMHQYDIAFASDSTSAAVDAYFYGLPVLVILDDKKLNFSPLRDQAGVHFVSTPKELAENLQTISYCSSSPASKDFFFLDSALPRWRKLLNEAFSGS